MGQIELKHRSTLCTRPTSRPTSVANIRPKLEIIQNRQNVRFLKKSISVPKIRTCGFGGDVPGSGNNCQLTNRFVFRFARVDLTPQIDTRSLTLRHTEGGIFITTQGPESRSSTKWARLLFVLFCALTRRFPKSSCAAQPLRFRTPHVFVEKSVIWKHESLLWKHDTLCGHHVHRRGAAGGRAGTTRDRHANILSCATVTCARARRSRARLFGARRPRQIAMPCHPEVFSPLKKQENEYAGTRFAGAVRPRAAFFEKRVSEYVPVTSLPIHSQPKHGVSLG